MLLTRARIAVFVDGCFWHSCPEHGTTPSANRTWWAEKLAANVRRDRATDEHLLELGWLVLRFWEHDDPGIAADLVVDAWRRRLPRLSPAAVVAGARAETIGSGS